MGRPSGWEVVDHGSDPVPGEPSSIRSMAREYQRISDAADDASTRLKSVKGSGWLTDWQGEAADVFVDAIKDTPHDLTKLVDSYAGVSKALSSWADTVDDTQYKADNALFDAKDAAGDLSAAQSHLSSAQSTLSHYQTAANTLSKTAAQYPAGSDVPAGVDVPTPAQLRAASDNTSVASGAVSSAQGDIAAAQSRIDAAKKLVNEARGEWEDGEHRTATAIGDAADAGLGKQSFWDKVFHSEVWEDIVKVAKVVVAVGGIIVMIVGGPLAWIVLGAALLILADTLYKMSKGQADGWDLAFALLDCIPGTKGLTTLAGLGGAAMALKGGRSGLKVAMASLKAGRNTITGATHGLSGGRYAADLEKLSPTARANHTLMGRLAEKYPERSRLFLGSRFNAERTHAYPLNEVPVEKAFAGGRPYRVDSYDPGTEIVSRKNTQLAQVAESTAQHHIAEFQRKYQSGVAVVADTPWSRANAPEQVGTVLDGSMTLEVPVQHLPVPGAVADAASRADITIRDPLGNAYNGPDAVSFSLENPVTRGIMVGTGAATAPSDFTYVEQDRN